MGGAQSSHCRGTLGGHTALPYTGSDAPCLLGPSAAGERRHHHPPGSPRLVLADFLIRKVGVTRRPPGGAQGPSPPAVRRAGVAGSSSRAVPPGVSGPRAEPLGSGPASDPTRAALLLRMGPAPRCWQGQEGSVPPAQASQPLTPRFSRRAEVGGVPLALSPAVATSTADSLPPPVSSLELAAIGQSPVGRPQACLARKVCCPFQSLWPLRPPAPLTRGRRLGRLHPQRGPASPDGRGQRRPSRLPNAHLWPCPDRPGQRHSSPGRPGPCGSPSAFGVLSSARRSGNHVRVSACSHVPPCTAPPRKLGLVCREVGAALPRR